MNNLLFLAQVAQGVNVGAGFIMLFAELACVAIFAIGAFEFYKHRSMLSLAEMIIAVIVAMMAPSAINQLAHGIGGSTNTIVPTAAN